MVIHSVILILLEQKACMCIQFNINLGTVLTFVTAHTFYASQDIRVSYGWCLLIQDIFVQFKTMRRKQNLEENLR